MEKRPLSEFMETTMQKVREMVDANTIIGDPVETADGVKLIPVSKVTLGFAGGGGGNEKKQQSDSDFGGIGAGIKIDPVAFIVVKGENVKMMYIAPPPASTLDKVIDTAPDIIEKISDFIKERKEEKEV